MKSQKFNTTKIFTWIIFYVKIFQSTIALDELYRNYSNSTYDPILRKKFDSRNGIVNLILRKLES